MEFENGSSVLGTVPRTPESESLGSNPSPRIQQLRTPGQAPGRLWASASRLFHADALDRTALLLWLGLGVLDAGRGLLGRLSWRETRSLTGEGWGLLGGAQGMASNGQRDQGHTGALVTSAGLGP